jgi:hypothetical protein
LRFAEFGEIRLSHPCFSLRFGHECPKEAWFGAF